MNWKQYKEGLIFTAFMLCLFNIVALNMLAWIALAEHLGVTH